MLLISCTCEDVSHDRDVIGAGAEVLHVEREVTYPLRCRLENILTSYRRKYIIVLCNGGTPKRTEPVHRIEAAGPTHSVIK